MKRYKTWIWLAQFTVSDTWWRSHINLTDNNTTDQERTPYPIALMEEALSRNGHVTAGDVEVDENYMRTGSLRQIIACAENGKPVCSLYLKQPMGPVETKFATDIAAWKATTEMPYCKAKQIPRAYIRWAHVATTHSYTYWHIEPNGYSSYFTCTAGCVLFIIQADSHRETSVLRYTSKVSEDYYQLEAACLWPGETM